MNKEDIQELGKKGIKIIKTIFIKKCLLTG